jgi:uncharacterized membrane protein
MPESPFPIAQDRDTYNSVALVAANRRQAIKVWSVSLVVIGLWISAIVGSPVAKYAVLDAIASPLNTFFSYICHRIPDRSFYILGEQFGVCSRCFGVYLGILIGIAVYPLWRGVDTIDPLPRFWLFLSLIPISIDWSLTVFGIWENTQFSRLITGAILGFVCATFIVPAMVEIARNFLVRPART